MLKNNYICALDIGSSKIAVAVAVLGKRHIVDLVFDTAVSKGVRRGAIVDSIELTSCVSALLKNVRAKSGLTIKTVYTDISGSDIVSRRSRAIIPLAERGNKVITYSDIRKANEQARILGSSLEEEILHQIPAGYTIDSKGGILNPLGLYSHKLEVDLYLVCAKVSSLQSLARALGQAGYEIKGVFFSGLATSEAIMRKEDKKGVTVLCDIGRDITEIILFNGGLLQDIKILPLGGEDLSMQIVQELKIPLGLAEEVLRSHASVGDYAHIKEESQILIKQNNFYKPIKQKALSQILTTKTAAMCLGIKESVEKLLPLDQIDTFIVSGRAVMLDGFLEMLESNIGISVTLGRITHPDMAQLVNNNSALSGQKCLTYLTSLGIISEALRKQRPRFLSDAPPPPNLMAKLVHKVKEVYQEYF